VSGAVKRESRRRASTVRDNWKRTANVDEVAELRRVDFFVLASNQQRGDSDELEFGAGDDLLFQVAVDEVDGEVEGFRDELELGVDLDQPVDENGAHALVDVGLVVHVDGTDRGGGFLVAVVLVHVNDVLGGAERVFLVACINVVGVSSDLVGVGIGLGATAGKGFASGGTRVACFVGKGSSDRGATSRSEDDFVVGVSDRHGASLHTVGALRDRGLSGFSVVAIANVGVGDILQCERRRAR